MKSLTVSCNHPRLKVSTQCAYDEIWGGGEADPNLFTVAAPIAALLGLERLSRHAGTEDGGTESGGGEGQYLRRHSRQSRILMALQLAGHSVLWPARPKEPTVTRSPSSTKPSAGRICFAHAPRSPASPRSRRRTRWSAPPIGTPPSGSSHRRSSKVLEVQGGQRQRPDTTAITSPQPGYRSTPKTDRAVARFRPQDRQEVRT